mgnify:FL=1
MIEHPKFNLKLFAISQKQQGNFSVAFGSFSQEEDLPSALQYALQFQKNRLLSFLKRDAIALDLEQQ